MEDEEGRGGGGGREEVEGREGAGASVVLVGGRLRVEEEDEESILERGGRSRVRRRRRWKRDSVGVGGKEGGRRERVSSKTEAAKGGLRGVASALCHQKSARIDTSSHRRL